MQYLGARSKTRSDICIVPRALSILLVLVTDAGLSHYPHAQLDQEIFRKTSTRIIP